MIILAPSGTPVLIVEAMNAQYQRRLAVFRTSGLTSDPSEILTAISDQLNSQPRRARAGLSPLQLLGLGKAASISRRRTLDRFLTRFDYRDYQLAGSELTLITSFSKLSDGNDGFFSLSRPFSAISDRWAMTIQAGGFSRNDRLSRRFPR